ncbi:MAG: peptide ABC transporter substrate-binding protein, partial [Hyphomicrobiales bacterium]|nr:peptide ABC transporter substrate-binding protein [Hyphomicrobiales bacterium]
MLAVDRFVIVIEMALPMPTSISRAAIAAAVFAAAFAACAAPVSAAPSEFRRGLAGTIATLDPQKATTFVEASALGDLFEGLVTFDARGALIPGAATSWTVSPDGLTYTFAVREGRWSNGDPLRAGDFVFAFRRLFSPATGAPTAGLFDAILGARAAMKGGDPAKIGVAAPDDRTLTIRLARPTPYFLALLALPAASPLDPAQVARDGADFARAGNLATDGAYRLVDFAPNGAITLARDPAFHDAAHVAIDVERIDTIEDRAQGLRRFEAGALDAYDDAPSGDLAGLRARLGDRLRVSPFPGTFYLALDTRHPPFDDARVRRALSLAVDRGTLARKVWGGAMAPATGFVPPGLGGYAPAQGPWIGPSPAARIAEARRLLHAAGYGEGGKPLTVEIRCNASENNRATMVQIAADWARVGVGASVRMSDLKSHFAFLRSGAPYDVARAGWVSDYPDAQDFLFLLGKDAGPLDYSHYADPVFEDLMARAA